MSESPPSFTPAAASTALAAAPATAHEIATGERDARGYDLSLYDWVPVLKKRRSDGWSPEKQRTFIEALADTGSVFDAARSVHMSSTSCYRLRRSPGAEGFAAAWDAAIEEGSKRLIDVAFDRVFNGTHEPILNRDGRYVGARIRYSDRLLMFLLRAHRPERYSLKLPLETRKSLQVPQLPVAEAIERLDPVQPAEPHRLMAPHQLEDALLCADMLEGELPGWRRDPDLKAPQPPTEKEKDIEELLTVLKQVDVKLPAKELKKIEEMFDILQGRSDKLANKAAR